MRNSFTLFSELQRKLKHDTGKLGVNRTWGPIILATREAGEEDHKANLVGPCLKIKSKQLGGVAQSQSTRPAGTQLCPTPSTAVANKKTLGGNRALIDPSHPPSLMAGQVNSRLTHHIPPPYS